MIARADPAILKRGVHKIIEGVLNYLMGGMEGGVPPQSRENLVNLNIPRCLRETFGSVN